MSGVEWWRNTVLNRAAVPAPLTVCPWARVALIAASTEPADCTHHPRPASKKARAQLYEIFILCVHFSSLFPLFLPFPIPHLAPLLPFSFSSATKQTRKTSLSHVFRLDFLPARKRSSISLAVASLLCLPGAKRLGMKRKEEKGGLDQEEMWERLSTVQGEGL